MLSRLWSKYSSSFINFALFILSLYSALFLAPFINKNYSNPSNIANQFNVLGFNPDSNYLQLIFVIIFTLLLFWGLRALYYSKFSWIIKLLPIFLILIHFFSNELIKFSVGYVFGEGALDTFHTGEQLSPSAAFLSGASLYDELFFFRGAGVDVLFPSAGLLLFGQSIGSFVLINHIYMFATIVSFFGLLFFLIKNPILYTLSIVFFYTSSSVVITQPRDIVVFIVLGLIFLYFKKNLPNKARKTALLLIGLLASLELFVAIDRGISLVAIAATLFVLLHFVKHNKDNVYSFNLRETILAIRKRRFQWLQKDLWLLPLGATSGIFLPAIIIGWDSFVAFVKMSFIEVPAYGGLLVAQPFPNFFTTGYVMWGPVLIAISVGYLLIELIKHNDRKYLNVLLPIIILFIYAIIALKFGSNRIDIAKMASVAAPMFVVAILTVSLALTVAYKNKRIRPTLIVPIGLSVISFVAFSQSHPEKLLTQSSVNKSQLVSYLKLLRSDDEIWLNQEQKDVRNYVASHTPKDSYIYSFTADPIYYYITHRKNPTRFYISWYADPQPYTNEVLNDLKTKKPELIIYQNGGPWDKPDNVSIEDRMPEVSKWILENYKRKTMIGTTVILEK